jgi:N-formylglutamate amidohydrolase
MTYPSWVVLHVPHDSTAVPADVRAQLSEAVVVRPPVGRLVVDVERFPDDGDEPMATRGMGAVYTATSQLTPLRRRLSAGEREALMQAYYRPHHARLEAAVAAALERHGRCLVIDCHSFPSVALPYEMADSPNARPDCLVESIVGASP